MQMRPSWLRAHSSASFNRESPQLPQLHAVLGRGQACLLKDGHVVAEVCAWNDPCAAAAQAVSLWPRGPQGLRPASKASSA